jgi:hypothetical protein
MSIYESKFLWLQSFIKRNLVKIQESKIRLILFNEFNPDDSRMANPRVINEVKLIMIENRL